MSLSNGKRKREEPQDLEDETDSDSDWENLALDTYLPSLEPILDGHDTTHSAEVTVELSSSTITSRPHTQRQATTALARRARLDIHKAHILCLLAHNATRNAWCRHDRIRAALKPVIDSFKVNLHPKATSAQYQRTRVLTEGLTGAVAFWSKRFNVVGQGLSRPKWRQDTLSSHQHSQSKPCTFADFVSAAKAMRGSRDIGAQLFVAFLHCQGLDVRLACSLQVLSFTLGKGNTIVSTANVEEVSSELTSLQNLPAKVTVVQATTPRRSLTRPSLGERPARRPEPVQSVVAPESTGSTDASPFPVYWAEVFDPAAQKWLPVDALCSKTVGKPTKLEPPAADHGNLLSYVLSYEADGAARDVTQRYATLYNAKTLKHRVDLREQGSQWWWEQVLPLYRLPKRHPGRAAKRDREAIEDASFQALRLKEPIPSNVQDFKRHPVFVLERDLRRDEVLDPEARECGSVIVSKARPPIMERVFPRKSVLQVRSAQQWYMRGRVFRPLEVPLKFRAASMWQQQARKRRQHRDDDDDDMEADTQIMDDVPYYTEAQTDAYIAPPVIQDENGKSLVPRNQFGNVDLYCASMLPAGALHLSCGLMRSRAVASQSDHIIQTWTDAQIARYLHELASEVLDIDAAPAVTGFKHVQATTTPTVDGIVVASCYADALEVAIDAGLAYIQDLADDAKSTLILQRWASWVQRLRIKHHVETRYAGTAESGPGGFMADEAEEEPGVQDEGDASETYSFEYESE
ncbi:hypothetical protein BCR37DRAFT_380361 [Protomyces lactucae-debilis]|uniref:Rad4-domain-containing protein n=1 Tax=Protomyces lactucae-debilis TaxID=2754530 RepID=A0A1Y2FF50_PROLT|nr:uncharacterized protein BCR37DRAFT_380361 [Protomyces lactucae-debilis]ORY81455.1 hypothetical protein BCR37DRAFT_380361 [Protomyces lactucae-debilis]